MAVDVQDQSILIIDDVTDTGDTLQAALDYAKSLGAGDTKTGVMQHKTTSSVVPDFYEDIIKDWRWIIYPWAAHEDLVGFTEKVLSVELETREQIRARLKEQYRLVLDENCLTEVLDDLIEMKKAEKIQAKYRKI